MLEQLGQKLKYRLSLPLPGLTAHLKMMHAERKQTILKYKTPEDAKQGAVLILLYKEVHAIKTVLILRQTYDGVHSGQIAFPGGKKDEGDESLADTALREAHEEIGIIKEDVKLIGELSSLYIPPSNFLVHPFVGTMHYKPGFFPNSGEVQKIVEVDIENFVDDSIIGEKEITLSNGIKMTVPYYKIEDYTVWGATAMMLSEFTMLLKEIEA